jgi:hypothetical protein
MLIAIRVNDEFENDKGKAKAVKYEGQPLMLSTPKSLLIGSKLEIVEYLNENNYERKRP